MISSTSSADLLGFGLGIAETRFSEALKTLDQMHRKIIYYFEKCETSLLMDNYKKICWKDPSRICIILADINGCKRFHSSKVSWLYITYI